MENRSSRFFRRNRRPLRCIYCDCEEFTWPQSFTQKFFEENACPDGRGHLYSDDRSVAVMLLDLHARGGSVG